MDFSLFSAVVAGFLATTMMSLAMELASLRGATSMPAMPLLLGSFVSGNNDLAMIIGSALHFVFIGSMLNGVAYGLVFALVGFSWMVAIALGLLQGALVGIGLGQVRRIHPRVAGGSARVRGGAMQRAVGELVVRDPGLFGVKWGEMTPVVLVGGYVLYALVFAFVYSLLG